MASWIETSVGTEPGNKAVGVGRLAPWWPVLLILLAAGGVFLLPYSLPPRTPAISQSYAVGFNNRVALICLGLLSVVATGISFVSTDRRSKQSAGGVGDGRVPWWCLIGAEVLMGLFVGWLSWRTISIHVHLIEDFYFIPQLLKAQILGMKPYRDLEFAYGALLFYSPIWVRRILAPLHLSISTAYYVTVGLHHALGIAMTFWVVNRVPLSRGLRIVAFLAITLLTFNTLLGLNYTLFRFVLPIFCLVLMARITAFRWAALAALGAAILQFLDSPDAGFAFTFAVCAYAAYRSWRHDLRWGWVGAGALAGTGIYLATEGPRSLGLLPAYAAGYGHLVVLPSPAHVFLIVMAVWLAPVTVGQAVKRDHPQGGLLVAIYAFALMMLSPALGGSDILHAVVNGLGFFLLSFVYLAQRKRWVRILGGSAISGVFVMLMITLAVTTHSRVGPILKSGLGCIDQPHHAAHLLTDVWPRLGEKLDRREQGPCLVQNFDMAKLRERIGSAKFAMPWEVAPQWEEEMLRSGQLMPSYYVGTIDVPNRAAQRRKIEELRQVDWLLAPRNMRPAQISTDVNPVTPIPHHTVHLRTRHIVFVDDYLVDEVDHNWTPVEEISGLWLFHRNSSPW